MAEEAEKPKTAREQILAAAVAALAEDADLAPSTSAKVAEAMADRVKADPVLQNSMNAEAPYQSRIMWGGAGGVLVSLGNVLTQVGECGVTDIEVVASCYDFTNLALSLGALGAAGFVLYGRYMPNLKPLFYKG